jgi:lysozyme
MTLREQLLLHEGLRLKPYKDTVGKLTIGIGRNLTDNGITKIEALILLDNDIHEATKACEQHIPVFRSLDDVRQRVLIDMAFNMGIHGLLGFRATLAAITAGDYAKAADRMLESKWAEQVGRRAQRLALWMRTGEIT